MEENTSLIFFISRIPREIWKNHICTFLERNDLANLRLSCSYFRKEIIYSPPIWGQWVPYDQLENIKETHLNLGWDAKPFALFYGVYFNSYAVWAQRVFPINNNAIGVLPHFLQALDISGYKYNNIEYNGLIEWLPKVVKKLSLLIIPRSNASKSRRVASTESKFLESMLNTYKGVKILVWDDLVFHRKGKKKVYDSMLSYACTESYSNIVQILIKDNYQEFKETINIACNYNVTPLGDAIANNNLGLAELLLQNGANPNGNYGEISILNWAMRYGKFKCVRLLKKYGAKESPNYNSLSDMMLSETMSAQMLLSGPKKEIQRKGINFALGKSETKE